MKRIVILICFLILLIGCSSNNIPSDSKKGTNETPTGIKTLATTSTEASISDSPVSSTKKDNAQKIVIIKASYEKPSSLNDKNTIFLNGLLEGDEYIEVIIQGEIYDFEQVELSWDESKNDLKEKETIKRIERLENQILVIKTYQPEGIPAEKLKWKGRTGKTYEYVIYEKSLGDTDNNISKYEMN